MNDAGGRAKLLGLGVRNVPVVARGERFVLGQDLEAVAEFVGLEGTGHTPLAPAELIRKWITILRAAQRFVGQLPGERLEERVIANRDRSIRLLCHHIFRIGEAFLEAAEDGVEYTAQLPIRPPEDGTCTSAGEIGRYGDGVIARLERWWAGLADRSCAWEVKTFFGRQPLHRLLERSTWHSAQHVRQLTAVLERLGLEPSGRLAPEDLAGLPLPERLWE